MMIENLTTPGADPVEGDLVRITHDTGAVEQKHWTPPPVEAPRPSLVLTALTCDDVQALVNADEVTCVAGSTITAVVELRDPLGNVIPLDAAFRMPLVARDGRERVLLVRMVSGIATITTTLPESGVWQVSEHTINQALPPEQQMAFGGLTAYVVQA